MRKFATVVTNINSGVVFRGTKHMGTYFHNISRFPGLDLILRLLLSELYSYHLLGPIREMEINDLGLLKKGLNNYLRATVISLTTSTVFFLVSSLSDAHPEILDRSSPKIYDVLIA